MKTHRIIALLAPLCLGACGYTAQPDQYRQAHAVTPVLKEQSFSLVPAGNGYMTSDGHSLAALVRAWGESGQGPMRLVGPRATAGRAAAALLAAGVPEASLQTSWTEAPAGAWPVVQFTGWTAILPACGRFQDDEWPQSRFQQYSNSADAEWGCASQRNMGAMLANPGDLNQARDANTQNAARNDALQTYHQTPDKPVAPKVGVSDVGQVQQSEGQ